jgi:hypothetical protein
MPKEYLGDSVYCTDDGFQIELTTENGSGPSNQIFMEPAVVQALFRYIERMRNVNIKISQKEQYEEEA